MKIFGFELKWDELKDLLWWPLLIYITTMILFGLAIWSIINSDHYKKYSRSTTQANISWKRSGQ